MVLQLLTSVGREIISHSWVFASIFIKFYLVAVVGYLYSRGGVTLDGFKEKLLNDSRLMILGLVSVGSILYIAGLEVEPVLVLFSEVVALLYFGYLFWAY